MEKKSIFDSDKEIKKIDKEFEDRIDNIIKQSDIIISREQSGCYLINYHDSYICDKFNGGCKNAAKCKYISEKIGGK
jgi:hypothetical protein